MIQIDMPIYICLELNGLFFPGASKLVQSTFNLHKISVNYSREQAGENDKLL